jgi:hypothetical protein
MIALFFKCDNFKPPILVHPLRTVRKSPILIEVLENLADKEPNSAQSC